MSATFRSFSLTIESRDYETCDGNKDTFDKIKKIIGNYGRCKAWVGAVPNIEPSKVFVAYTILRKIHRCPYRSEEPWPTSWSSHLIRDTQPIDR